MDEQRQQMPENLRRNGDDAVGRQQRAQDVRVAECIGHRQLGQHAGRQPEVDADREDVAAAHPAADAEDELVALAGSAASVSTTG